MTHAVLKPYNRYVKLKDSLINFPSSGLLRDWLCEKDQLICLASDPPKKLFVNQSNITASVMNSHDFFQVFLFFKFFIIDYYWYLFILFQMSACFSLNIFIKLGLSLTICTIIRIYLIKI